MPDDAQQLALRMDRPHRRRHLPVLAQRPRHPQEPAVALGDDIPAAGHTRLADRRGHLLGVIHHRGVPALTEEPRRHA
jgi:hypothetical protein